jgi:hypothetical protein
MPWYYAGPEAKPVGPVTLEELRALRARGGIAPETYVIEDAGQGPAGLAWKRYRDIFPAQAILPPLPSPATPYVPPPAPPVPPVMQAHPAAHPLFPSASPIAWPATVLPASVPSPGAPFYTHGPRPDPYNHARQTNGYCAWGFGFGLAAFFFSFVCGIGVFPALAAIPLCIFGLIQLGKHHEQTGHWLAISGLVLSSLALVVVLLWAVYFAMPIMRAHGLTVTEETTNDSQ